MKEELTFAFRRSIPVFFGYLFLGIAFGLLMQSAGYGFVWSGLSSVFIYAGSGQFALVGWLSGGAALLTMALLTLSINSRHIFYGLSFIEKFKSMGKRGTYMILSLTDETYSLLCSTVVPKELDEDKTFFYIALLNQIYWVLGSLLGALIGQLNAFNSEGIEFSMTALFTVIFVEQWLSSKNHLPAIFGAVCGVVSLLAVGADKFVLPALVGTVALLSLLRAVRPETKGAEE